MKVLCSLVLIVLTAPLLSCAQSFPRFTGTYQLKVEPLRIFAIEEENGKLFWKDETHIRRVLRQESASKFMLDSLKTPAGLEFAPGKLYITQDGRFEALKIRETTDLPKAKRIPNRRNGFTRADTLRGQLSGYRSCYDVTYYHLDAAIAPARRHVSGSNLIRFKALADIDTLQIDLYENMVLEKILYKGRELRFTREYDAVFVRFPATVPRGMEEEIIAYYHGQPQEPDRGVPMNGGFLWRKDRDGKDFAQVVCQGSGASLWWPNKDHLSDEPDSMLISITVPPGLQNISNGRLRAKKELADGSTRTDWFVSYPINNYNVTVNIGDYVRFSDIYVRHGDTLTLDYYCLPYHLEKAKALSQKVKPMLAFYEQSFGPYPFPRDGFTLIETLHAMEHQSAVALGGFGGDAGELERLMWHEVAHEWWGNSLSCKDMADFWLHEGFATYAEKMMIGQTKGEEAALKALEQEKPANREPLIGEHDVNHIFYELWDVYSKGCRVIHTLRSVLDDSAVFFDVLKALQEHFRYQTITTEDVTAFVAQVTHRDLSGFFEQYLRQTSVPELTCFITKEDGALYVYYKWSGTVERFRMPVKVTLEKDSFSFIYPEQEWKRSELKDMTEKDFKVRTEDFYIRVKRLSSLKDI
ncbi:M1 family metallopeptidase [Chitinophaga cymbidii]|uniref:Peptidase M1 n=1 Tax=Chitinophaga cymbidii TaxID=1096750 RepID=A0A512RRI8_9BACT|nr:M1 family metallopeptidase [Chitinophaga cymbidii]GEP98302.1 peptidase M1 [Chitinophaga cymbidii]